MPPRGITQVPRAAPVPMDYVNELGQQRASETIRDLRRNSSEDNSIGCWLFTGSKNKDGYGQVYRKKNSELHLTGRSTQKAWLIHRVAYVARTGRDAEGHASHLCDNRACFNPDHIVDETAQVNNSRKGCPGLLTCGYHHHVLLDMCPHTPQCLRPERFDISCCLALKESDPQGWATATSSSGPQSSQSGPQSSQPLVVLSPPPAASPSSGPASSTSDPAPSSDPASSPNPASSSDPVSSQSLAPASSSASHSDSDMTESQ